VKASSSLQTLALMISICLVMQLKAQLLSSHLHVSSHKQLRFKLLLLGMQSSQQLFPCLSGA